MLRDILISTLRQAEFDDDAMTADLRLEADMLELSPGHITTNSNARFVMGEMTHDALLNRRVFTASAAGPKYDVAGKIVAIDWQANTVTDAGGVTHVNVDLKAEASAALVASSEALIAGSESRFKESRETTIVKLLESNPGWIDTHSQKLIIPKADLYKYGRKKNPQQFSIEVDSFRKWLSRHNVIETYCVKLKTGQPHPRLYSN